MLAHSHHSTVPVRYAGTGLLSFLDTTRVAVVQREEAKERETSGECGGEGGDTNGAEERWPWFLQRPL